MEEFSNLGYHGDIPNISNDYVTIGWSKPGQNKGVGLTTDTVITNQQGKMDALVKQNTNLKVMLGVFITLFALSVIALIMITVGVLIPPSCQSSTIPLHQTDAASEMTIKSSLHSTKSSITTNDPPTDFLSDCHSYKQSGYTEDGVYGIRVNTPDGHLDKYVYCDMTTDGGGWTVLLKRQDGSVDFYQDWADYKDGFGLPSGEYWIGNDMIHYLTALSGEVNSVRFDLQSFDEEWRFAVYSKFKVENETNKYQATIGIYSGDAGDSFFRCNGQYFSTKDRDNDGYHGNCAARYPGGWWFDKCHANMLTGLYGPVHDYAEGVTWRAWLEYYKFLKFADMKIRPV